MKNINQIQHPMIKHYVSNIRDNSIPSNLFRRYIATLANLLFYEATKDEKYCERSITTWIGEGKYPCIDEKNFVFIPILRAALPMLDGLLENLPNASAGFLAMKRDEETLAPKIYYDRIPNLDGKVAVVLDPMVATGGSLIDAFEMIKKKNPAKIISLNILASPNGIESVNKAHPDIAIYIAQIDKELNDSGFIIPGIGDAGDRAYNTL